MDSTNWSTAPLASLPPLLRDKDPSGEPSPQEGCRSASDTMSQGQSVEGFKDLTTDKSKAALQTLGLDAQSSKEGADKSTHNEQDTTSTGPSAAISFRHTNIPSPLPDLHTTSASSVKAFSPPYFRLTDQEHKNLHKKMHQSSKFVFSNLRLARELEDLGRGWSAFVRAQDQARQDGSLATFELQLKAELDETARLGTTYSQGPGATQRFDEYDMPLPPSAVSMQSAQEASEQIAKRSGKRKRAKTSGLDRLTKESNNGAFASNEESGADPEQPDEYRGRSRPRGSKDKMHTRADLSQRTPRPKRTQARPDYAMTKTHESIRSSSASTIESPRSPSPTPREIYESLEPQFVEYACEWKGCKATLINLGTLKKHISVVHSNEARENFRCLWGRCGDLDPPMLFCSLSDVDSHIRERHVDEIAWKMGEGIGGVSGEPVVPDFTVKPPLYLLRNGVQVEGSNNGQMVKSRVQSQAMVKQLVGDMYDDENEAGPESSDDDDDDKDILAC